MRDLSRQKLADTKVYNSADKVYSLQVYESLQEQSWSSGLGTSLLTRGSCVRIPLRSRLEGSQCHPPAQGGTGCGKMDDISPSPTVGPALSRPWANNKKKKVDKNWQTRKSTIVEKFHIHRKQVPTRIELLGFFVSGMNVTTALNAQNTS